MAAFFVTSTDTKTTKNGNEIEPKKHTMRNI